MYLLLVAGAVVLRLRSVFAQKLSQGAKVVDDIRHGHDPGSSVDAVLPEADGGLRSPLWQVAVHDDFLMSEDSAATKLLEEQQAQCERDVQEDYLMSPFLAEEAADASVANLFANVEDEYLDWLYAHGHPETGGLMEARDTQREVWRLRKLSRAYVRLRHTLNESGMCIQPRSGQSGVVDMCKDLNPTFLLRESHSLRRWGWFKRTFRRAVRAVRKVTRKVAKILPEPIRRAIKHVARKAKAVVKHIAGKAKAIVTHIAGKSAAFFGMMKAAKIAMNSLKTSMACFQNSPDPRYKLDTMLKILGRNKGKGVAHDVEIIKNLFKYYIGGMVKNFKALFRTALREVTPRAKKLLQIPKKMSLAEFWKGGWLAGFTNSAMQFFTAMSKAPELGPFGCVSQHFLIPSMRVITGSVNELVLKGLRSVKNTYDYLSNRAVQFITSGIKKLLRKYPAMNVAFSHMQNVVYRFCMKRVNSLDVRVKGFLVDLKGKRATEAEYKELAGALSARFDVADIPKMIADSISQVGNYTSRLLMDATDGILDKGADFIQGVAKKVTDFAIRVVVTPIKLALLSLKTMALKMVDMLAEAGENLLKKIALTVNSLIIGPITLFSKDIFLSVINGVQEALEGVLGIVPYAGSVILDLVTEPLQFIETMVSGQIPLLIKKAFDSAIELFAWLFKKMREAALYVIDKSFNFIASLDTTVRSLANTIVQAGLDSMKSGVHTLVSTILSTVQSTLQKAANAVVGAGTGITSILGQAFKNAFGGKLWHATKWVTSLMNPMIEAVNTVIRNITYGVSDKMRECDEVRQNTEHILHVTWNVAKNFQELA